MASMWRKAMLYLGLGPDDEYDDFDVAGEHQRAPARSPVRRSEPQHDPEPSGSVRTLPPSPGEAPGGHERHERHERYDRHDGGRNGHGQPHENGRAASGRGDRERSESRLEVARTPSRRLPSASSSGAAEGSRGGAVVKPLPTGSSKPFVVGPSSFNDAQEVADKFKVNVPVIVNLQGVERDLARRIIDFSSGLCYGLGGQMERVANQVYLLTPSEVEVSPEERRRLRERGYEA
jgi:cell division inhibitor SepF